MKTVHETFTDEEHEILKIQKGKRTWHNFIMTLKNQTHVLISGEIKIPAVCPECGHHLNVDVSQITADAPTFKECVEETKKPRTQSCH